MDSEQERIATLAVVAEDQQKEAARLLKRLDDVRQELANTGGQLSAGVQSSAKQAISNETQTAVDSMNAAAARLDRARQRFRWKAITTTVVVAVVAVAAIIGVSYAGVAWQWHRIAQLQDTKADLQAAVSRLESLGGKIDLTRCGDERRPCVAVDPDSPIYGTQREYRIIAGY